MDFSDALHYLKDGAELTRVGWNGPNQYIKVMWPEALDGVGDMSLPYIYIRTVTGDTVPWLASQGDLFAEDWTQV